MLKKYGILGSRNLLNSWFLNSWFLSHHSLCLYLSSLDSGGPEVTWLEVPPGETLPFTFEGRGGKLRHLNTHDMKIHQVVVRVDGWQEVTPVSVDRVGTYFRY